MPSQGCLAHHPVLDPQPPRPRSSRSQPPAQRSFPCGYTYISFGSHRSRTRWGRFSGRWHLATSLFGGSLPVVGWPGRMARGWAARQGNRQGNRQSNHPRDRRPARCPEALNLAGARHAGGRRGSHRDWLTRWPFSAVRKPRSTSREARERMVSAAAITTATSSAAAEKLCVAAAPCVPHVPGQRNCHSRKGSGCPSFFISQ